MLCGIIIPEMIQAQPLGQLFILQFVLTIICVVFGQLTKQGVFLSADDK